MYFHLSETAIWTTLETILKNLINIFSYIEYLAYL